MHVSEQRGGDETHLHSFVDFVFVWWGMRHGDSVLHKLRATVLAEIGRLFNLALTF